jgi:hypothetical protein
MHCAKRKLFSGRSQCLFEILQTCDPLAKMWAFLAKNRKADCARGGSTNPHFQFFVSWQMLYEPFARRRCFSFVDVFRTRKTLNLFLKISNCFFTAFDAELKLFQITVEERLKLMQLQEWNEPGVREFREQGPFQFQHPFSGLGFFLRACLKTQKSLL